MNVAFFKKEVSMIKYVFAAISLSASSLALAESFPLDLPPSNQQNTKIQASNGFTYPDKTHLDSDEIYHDVIFFYSNDMFDFFGNDAEALTSYVEGSIEINTIEAKFCQICLCFVFKNSIRDVLPPRSS